MATDSSPAPNQQNMKALLSMPIQNNSKRTSQQG